jgi:hypothetical protein
MYMGLGLLMAVMSRSTYFTSKMERATDNLHSSGYIHLPPCRIALSAAEFETGIVSCGRAAGVYGCWVAKDIRAYSELLVLREVP